MFSPSLSLTDWTTYVGKLVVMFWNAFTSSQSLYLTVAVANNKTLQSLSGCQESWFTLHANGVLLRSEGNQGHFRAALPLEGKRCHKLDNTRQHTTQCQSEAASSETNHLDGDPCGEKVASGWS